jgi:xanthine phosphoribosyltransferase
MITKPLSEIIDRIKSVEFKENFDTIVAIAKGGIIPAALLMQKLNVDIEFLWLEFRDETQKPKYDEPVLTKPINFLFKNKTILLVDDRSNTGKTFKKASELLKGAKLIKTCAVNGKSDYSLFDEECFTFPWNIK